MEKIISTMLTPNADKDQLELARELLRKKASTTREATSKLENDFREYFGTEHAFAFAAGRTALTAALRALNLQGSEVIIQAYTCATVPSMIIAARAKPVFVDIEEKTFNINPQKIADKITPKTKAILVQHTFGRPADLTTIKKIADKYNLKLIEDCAHSLGAKYNNQPIGTFGDIAIFSFGRDKVISSTHGGMVITNNSEYAKYVKNHQNSLSNPPEKFIRQALRHPLVYEQVKKYYNFAHLGKLIAEINQRLKQISEVMTAEEKYKAGINAVNFKLADPLAQLARQQFAKLDQSREIRRQYAEEYFNTLKQFNLPARDDETYQSAWLRFTIRTSKRQKLIDIAKKNKVLLGPERNIWYSAVIAPLGIDPSIYNYKPRSCPVAEKTAQRSLNLPISHTLTENEIEKICQLLT